MACTLTKIELNLKKGFWVCSFYICEQSWLRHRPRLHRGSLQHSSDPLLDFRGHKEEGNKMREGRGRERHKEHNLERMELDPHDVWERSTPMLLQVQISKT